MERNKKETIGTLREYIIIERATTTENAFADKVQTWSELLPVWAAVEYPLTKSGEEYERVKSATCITMPSAINAAICDGPNDRTTLPAEMVFTGFSGSVQSTKNLYLSIMLV